MELSVFENRRLELLQCLSGDALAVIPSATMVLRNRDVHYPFRQHSDFWYLTGFPEQDAVAVLFKKGDVFRYVLFCQPKDPVAEVWMGERVGVDGACTVFGADEAYSIQDFDTVMGRLLQEASNLYTLSLPQLTVGQYQHSVLSGALAHCRLTASALEDHLHLMRLTKDENEMACMRLAAEVSVRAHQQAMRMVRPGMHAYEVQAALEHVMLASGCHHQAYEPIVAPGKHACVLHYTDNDAVLCDGDLLLIDAGAESDYYACDITRTFPINGRFTDEQKALYNVVLDAQNQVITAIEPGVTWDVLHALSVKVIVDGLLQLGILVGDADALIESQAHKPFYMHGIGHWLGLDVHDVGSRLDGDQPRRLAPHMVLTVEPGIYIAPGSDGIDPKWYGIGIRIEDDVLVTEQGCDVLTESLVKDPDGIEALMQQD